jgi:hypothetical protein
MKKSVIRSAVACLLASTLAGMPSITMASAAPQSKDTDASVIAEKYTKGEVALCDYLAVQVCLATVPGATYQSCIASIQGCAKHNN